MTRDLPPPPFVRHRDCGSDTDGPSTRRLRCTKGVSGVVASGWSRRGAWLRWAAFALLITVALAACGRRAEEGGGDTELDARNEATQVNTIFNASPEALASPA